ncbi:MAG: hypothetical protein ABI234_09260 [Ktedonobacteraceae bacterium]
MLCVICGFLLTLLFLLSRLWCTSATTAQATRAHTHLVTMVKHGKKSWLPVTAPGNIPWPPLPGSNAQVNSQNLQGSNSAPSSTLSVGSNQGNSGNQGENHGFNQDSSSNRGNAISSQRKAIGLQANNQILQGDNSGGDSSTSTIGFDQGNTGNQGYNTGLNQDNSANSGNQVNNQGAVIGTQINHQGSDVNNDGSTIQHQINYVSLLPTIQLHLGLTPRPQLSLRVN